MNSKEKGMTLLEVLLSTAIFLVIVAITFSSLSTFWRGFTGIDSTHQLKSYSQKTVNKLQLRLSECKRIFQDDTVGNLFLARLKGTEALLPDSRLSIIEETGSLDPTSSSFVSSSVGNSILFTSTEFPEVLEEIFDSGGDSYTVRIDKYIFNYYYLSPISNYTLGGTCGIRLLEWHSQGYADGGQIGAISNATKRANTIIALRNRGIQYAWMPSGSDPEDNATFYRLNTNGTVTSQGSGFWIGEDNLGQDTYTQKDMTHFAKGTLGGKYRAGISPNTGGTFNPGNSVPLFAAANGSFPAGFEIVIVGPRSAHRIFIRVVLAAEGYDLQKVIENSVLVSVRNLW